MEALAAVASAVSAAGDGSALRNVEVKARVPAGALGPLLLAAQQLSGGPPHVLQQSDVFFPLPAGQAEPGRLKLRRCGPQAQLIWYSRADRQGAKLSQYRLAELSPEQADALQAVLAAALGEHPPLCKTRQLFLVGQTRIHVDNVRGLGDFMELEVVLRPDQTAEDGQRIVDHLLLKLGICEKDLLSGAYLDMLKKPNNNKD